MFCCWSDSANSLRRPPLASARAANGWLSTPTSTRPERIASSEAGKPVSTSLMSFSGSRPFCFSSRNIGPRMPEPNTLVPTLLPFMSAMVLIGLSSFTAQ